MSRLVVVLAIVFLFGSPAAAAGRQSEHWTVTQLTGDARVIHPGFQAASLKINMELAPGDALVTGKSGRATLVHGKDYILVAPNSELKLPAGQPSGFTRVIETMGSILFKVEHTAVPHFAVETPMLAAVVKGTTFNVVVDQQRTSVEVIQGIVQVSAYKGGMTRLIEGGHAVAIDPREPAKLFDANKADSSPATEIKLPASGWTTTGSISKQTGGLISAEMDMRPIPVTTELLNAVEPVVSPSVALGASGPVNVAIATAPRGSISATVQAPVAGPVTGTISSVTSGSVTVPGVATPVAGVPSATAPAVTVTFVPSPPAAISVGTNPTSTIAAVTAPAVTVPTLGVSNGTVPGVTPSAVTTPALSVPAVATPVLTVPLIAPPAIPLLGH